MKEVFNKFMNNELDLNKSQKIGIFCLLTVFSGIFGWVYEFIFYYFNDGKFSFQGGNFLPWINIYAIGSIMIFILSNKFKKKPLLVFLIAFISTGILEYIAGYLVYTIGNGTRYWDYNTEILNFGNISGFVCLRSVLFFGISGLFLMYVMLPFIIYLSTKLNKKVFLIISITLFSIILFDEFYNLIFSKILSLPGANTIYKGFGIK